MLIEDSFEVSVSPDDVWALFMDIPRVSACLPGVESVEETSPDHYQGVLKVKVGPISASFDGQVEILERQDNQRRIVAQVVGKDAISSTTVKAVFTSEVMPSDVGARVDFGIDVALRGRLATFGSAVVKGTAKKMTAEFSRCVQEALAV